MDASLYGGLSGMALFYGHLARESGVDRFRELAELCLSSVRLEVARSEAGLGNDGAFSGEAGVIYTLLRLHELWGAPDLLELAKDLCQRVAPRIEESRTYDFVGGTAGLTMAYLELYRQTSDAHALQLAKRCGELLLQGAQSVNGGCGWVNHGSKNAIAGFAHGAAGISLALAELWRATSDPRFRTCALAGVVFEDSLYSEQERNWMDTRDTLPAPQSSVAWCNGAPGIGIARLRMLASITEPQLERDLQRALEKTVSGGLIRTSNCLCHGAMGNLELPWLVATRADDAALKRQVLHHASALLHNARTSQGNWQCGIPGTAQTPNFMVGLSGIGYQLLRFANPTLPSVLAWETNVHSATAV